MAAHDEQQREQQQHQQRRKKLTHKYRARKSRRMAWTWTCERDNATDQRKKKKQNKKRKTMREWCNGNSSHIHSNTIRAINSSSSLSLAHQTPSIFSVRLAATSDALTHTQSRYCSVFVCSCEKRSALRNEMVYEFAPPIRCLLRAHINLWFSNRFVLEPNTHTYARARRFFFSSFDCRFSGENT